MAKTPATRMKLGPVSGPERARYRARILNDAEWGRPTPSTAVKVCALVGVNPSTLRTARDLGEDADRVAAQAFTVALDTVIMLGDRMLDEDDEAGAQLTFNAAFDALARYWSLRYRAAQLRGATISYDMAEATLVGAGGDDGGAWRELLVAGVNVEAIWDLLTRQVEPSKRVPRQQPHPGLAGYTSCAKSAARDTAAAARSDCTRASSSTTCATTILHDPSTGARTPPPASRRRTRPRRSRFGRRSARSGRTTS